jgi:alpha-1,2-glucosyltransferase
MSYSLQNWPLQVVLLATLSASLAWHYLVTGNVPDPYLVSAYNQASEVLTLMCLQDEFFHVPQAQKYCEGDYTWDPKITTPPGL